MASNDVENLYQNSDSNSQVSPYKHVLILSIDGLHNSDLSVANLQSSLTNIKRLQREGVTYTNAFTSAPSDSFPGELNYITGANPGTTGVFYDKSYSRTLYAPGTTLAQIQNGTAKPGTGVEFAENVDASWNNGKGGTLDGGKGFDPTQLPVDSNGNPVYPNQYLKVNTIFDVASQAGLTTAWSDKHPAAYTILAGNTQDPTQFNFATGQVGSISDYSSLEINAAVAIDPSKKGPLSTSIGALVDQSTGTPYSNTNTIIQNGVTVNGKATSFFNDATKGNPTLYSYYKANPSALPTGFTLKDFTSVATTSTYDDYKVKQILNEIDGLNDSGTTSASTPAIFGMNFQAVSVGEKEPGTLFNGGGIDANGNARPDLVSAVNHTDKSIGLILNELQKTGQADSTLVVLTSKHGQNPVQDPTVGLSSTFDSQTGKAGGDGNLTAFGALLVQNGIQIADEAGGDTSSLIFLKDPSQVQKAVALLNTKNYSFDNTADKVSDPTGKTLFSTQDAAAQGTVLSGQAIINAGLGDPTKNDRTPDIIVELNEGYFFGNATKKRSEHGGFTDADTHVALIAGSAGLADDLQGTTNSFNVSTTQIAPTVLEALGLDPNELQGVQIDGTQDLKGLLTSDKVTDKLSNHKKFTPGNLLISRSVYTGADLNVGDILPNGSKAVADGSYPNVWNNETPDPSFGVTSPIFLDQVTTKGKVVSTKNVTELVSNQLGTDLSTSFSSKSELALNLTPDGKGVTFVSYLAEPNTLDVSNSNTPGHIDPTNPVTSTFQRAITTIDSNGNVVDLTPINAYSGNNGRAAILGTNGLYYTVGNAGNSGSGVTGTTLSDLSSITGVQAIKPGDITGDTTVVGQPKGTVGSSTGNQNGFSIADLGLSPDKTGKDDNFRGLTLNPFDNSLYVSKGSGSNGINTVYKVSIPTGSGSTLPTLTNADTASISILPGFSTTLANSKTGVIFHPFGLWFADSTTLYVADEGTPLTTTGANAVPLTDAAKDVNAGLEKWSLVNGIWKLDYTLQNGLNLGKAYRVANGADPEVYPTSLDPATAGLRNITGKVNRDGTVSIYAVTSTVSTGTDQGADPNKVVAITDLLSANTLPTAERFTTVESAKYGEVLRGVSFTPSSTSKNPITDYSGADALVGRDGFSGGNFFNFDPLLHSPLA